MTDHSLFYCTTADSAEIYWEKPHDAAPSAMYSVFLDGKPAGQTDRTHFTLEPLRVDTAYTAEVHCGDAVIGCAVLRTSKARRRLNAHDFGATGDGRTMDTKSLQAAIDACGPEDEVYLPAGVYRTGALRLHSRMSLYVDADAVLQGTDRPEDYLPKIPSRFEGIEQMCYSSLLNLGHLDHRAGPNCHDVLIYGKGTISGGGQPLAEAVIEKERESLKGYLSAHAELVASCENDSTIPGRARPRLINMSNCQNIRITGLTLQNGASWNVHMIYSRDIVTDHCIFRSKGIWNGDGWDPDSSENCTLFACRFYTGDDAVAIKSGKNPEGNEVARPARHIRVFDCVSELGHGITIGSEMSGGVEDVRIWDCDLAQAVYGFEIKGTAKRGGYVRDIHLLDCVVARVLIHAVGYNDDGVPAPEPPVFQHFKFTRIQILGQSLAGDGTVKVCPAVEMQGFDAQGHEICDVQFVDCTVGASSKGLCLQQCTEVSFLNLRCME